MTGPTGCLTTTLRAIRRVLQQRECPQAGARTAGRKRRNRGDPAAGQPPFATGVPSLSLYEARHPIKNFCAKLEQFRAIATRGDKTAWNFLAATAMWLNRGRALP